MIAENMEVSLITHSSTKLSDTKYKDIRGMIYIIRGQQVILDYDLAFLYQVETKRLNERVKRNKLRFPETFCFQLTKEEFDTLRSQIAASSEEHGGRRYLPYAFTEAGIAMLSAVLHSKTAIDVSIRIMNTFVEMRRFISNNAMLFDRISAIELKQLEYQKQTDKKIDQIFDYISDHTESSQKIFFDGQIYDAFSLLAGLMKQAKTDIILIDGYVDIGTLNILAKKQPGVNVVIYTFSNTRLTVGDVSVFNRQYPNLTIQYNSSFHDRFLILDHSIAYHIGASIKDAGKKCFGITLIEDQKLVHDLLSRL